MRLSVEEKLLLIVVAATLTGALLLLSSGQGSEPGQKPWRADSGLHFVTRLLNFDYAFPTPKGVTVKRLARGAGAAAALVLAAIMWVRRHSESINPFPVRGQPIETAPAARPQRWSDAVTAADGAQLALLAFVAWSFISALWAPWPAVALGESALLAMGAVWAMCLGRCLSRRGAVAGTLILLALLVLTAAIGLWYYYERNPVQRLKFPIGNPLFMAACLLPGVVVAFCLGIGSARKAVLARCERCTVGAMAALLALAPLCWALRLTDSRGAMLGSGVGLWAAAYVCARGIWRWLLVGLGVVGIVLAAGFFHHRMANLEGGRGASMRTRIYGWRYAGELFLSRPVQGLGQGGYSLQAETLSLADAENDPLAFPGDRFTHAHNEWLETLADLGAVGITLLAMAFGLTFWGCRHVVQARAGTLEGWCYVGLIAGMAALAAEEATDVALRLPGLPVVWYTVLGLIWALMRREARPAQRAVPFAKPVRWSGAALAVALAAGLLTWSVWNWHGALAQARVAELLNRQQWLQAQTAAIVGRQGRLGADEVADSLAQKLFCHIRIVGFHLDSLMTSAQGRPLAETAGTPLGSLQQNDLEVARAQLGVARLDGITLLSHAPAYRYAAGELGQALVYWVHVERSLQTDLPEAGAEAAVADGKRLLLREYLRNRLDVEAALRCVAAMPERPVGERLDWLRTALRSGRGADAIEMALQSLAAEPGFDMAFSPRVQAAQVAAQTPDPQRWPDAFAPETFRLWSMLLASQDRWPEAASCAGDAVGLYKAIHGMHPTLVSATLAYQAWCTFQAAPDEAAAAIELAQAALAAVPPIGEREALAAPIRQSMVLFHLAAGQESDAAAIIARLGNLDDEQVVMRGVGFAYAELARQFARLAAAHRPERFAAWFERATALAPEAPDTQLIRVQLAFEAEAYDELVAALVKGESAGMVPAFIDDVLARALQQAPDNEALLRYAAERRAATQPVTQPATRPAIP